MALILAVDDERAGLYFRRLILEHAGYSVLTATGVDEALHLFSSHAVDLVVTDHLLGRNTGTDMAQEMKRTKPSVPIIVLSGTSSIPEPLQHADAFLSKTEGPQELLELIRQLLPTPAKPVSSTVVASQRDAATLQAFLASVVESSDDAILTKTLDGTILTWNKAAERMYGYTAQEVIGQKVSILLPPDRSTEADNILRRLARGELIDHFDTTRRTKDGRILHVSLTISPVRDPAGNIFAASTIARDMSQVKHAEAALRNSERLAVAGRMAGIIAHEINNPLETVTNILYLLKHNPSLDETARGWVQQANDELQRVGQITRGTLGFYRERDTAVTPVKLSDLLESILSLYQRRLQSVGAKVEKRFESEGQVAGVAGELRQVFSNLVANAIDALAVTGDRLLVHVCDSVDWLRPNRKGVRVTVSDDGAGMTRATQASLFQPFYTTKGREGTGLGLWVSQGIISNHGGSIRVRSRTGPHHGTCFNVFLPAEPSGSVR